MKDFIRRNVEIFKACWFQNVLFLAIILFAVSYGAYEAFLYIPICALVLHTTFLIHDYEEN